MKTLQEHLTECLVNEAYKAQFKSADWDKVLDQFKPAYSNYSQIGSLEDYIDGALDIDEWIDNMFEGGVQDTPENREILNDIALWTEENYEISSFGWRDDAESIMDYGNDLKKDTTMWGVSLEDYAVFVYPKKKLSGNDKKLGEVLAKHGNSDGLEELIARHLG